MANTISLVPDSNPATNDSDQFDCWVATMDADGRPMYDAVGGSPLLAMAALAKVLADALTAATPEPGTGVTLTDCT